MYWHPALAILSGVLAVAAIVPYIKDIFYGTTRPNAVSWFLWTLLQGIAMAAQFSAGASWSVVLLVVITVNTAVVTVLALTGYGYHAYGRTDIVCFVLALIAVAAWQATKDPIVAIGFAIFADLFASVPTLVKALIEPASESLLGWWIIMFASLASVLSANIINAPNLAYPVYMVFIDATTLGALYVGWARRRQIG